MTEKILILILPLVFLGTFIFRNRIVKVRAGRPIRSLDRLVRSSIILSTACILLTIVSVFFEPFYRLTGVISFLRLPLISYLGFVLFVMRTNRL